MRCPAAREKRLLLRVQRRVRGGEARTKGCCFCSEFPAAHMPMPIAVFAAAVWRMIYLDRMASEQVHTAELFGQHQLHEVRSCDGAVCLYVLQSTYMR